MHPPNPITLPSQSDPDPLARFRLDLLLAARWFTEAGKAQAMGDELTAEVYRVRGERIHDRINEILDEAKNETA